MPGWGKREKSEGGALPPFNGLSPLLLTAPLHLSIPPLILPCHSSNSKFFLSSALPLAPLPSSAPAPQPTPTSIGNTIPSHESTPTPNSTLPSPFLYNLKNKQLEFYQITVNVEIFYRLRNPNPLHTLSHCRVYFLAVVRGIGWWREGGGCVLGLEGKRACRKRKR